MAYMSSQENPGSVLESSLDQSDSDQEDAENLDLSPFTIDWLDLDFVGCPKSLGICALPGCRFKSTWRSLLHDLQCLKQAGVEDVFCLCTRGEFHLYRCQDLLEKYSEHEITVHHYPVNDGQVPPMEDLMKIIEDLRVCLMMGKRTVVHCFGGLGRSCVVVACTMMAMDETLRPEDVFKKLRDLRGAGAIQTVKQYNFVNEFHELQNRFNTDRSADDRSASR
ncbi:unnamed protein product [Candidula unifasciata]|uniref:protein-tyrosine-phosphatase n=1 Tax=Candidula unifasciata TaxID=100452 RepID=A0A8S3ZBA4_9EUPU|nr:unnamed protein product [Candidula unifasciata]